MKTLIFHFFLIYFIYLHQQFGFTCHTHSHTHTHELRSGRSGTSDHVKLSHLLCTRIKLPASRLSIVLTCPSSVCFGHWLIGASDQTSCRRTSVVSGCGCKVRMRRIRESTEEEPSITRRCAAACCEDPIRAAWTSVCRPLVCV